MAILHNGQLRIVDSSVESRHQHEASALEQAYLKCISPEFPYALTRVSGKIQTTENLGTACISTTSD